jgi:PKD repeat protein
MSVRSMRSGLFAVVVTGTLIAGSGLAAYAYSAPQPNLVTAVPGTNTPNIANGIVYAITQVGSKIIVGGSFTSVSPPGTTSGAVTRNYLFAFDSTTGAIDNSFVPQLDAGPVEGLTPGVLPDTVYVAGYFNTVNGAKSKSIALIDTDTGALVSGWKPPALNGAGWAAKLANGHLIVGGTFTTANSIAHAGFVSLNPTTGAMDTYINVQVSGHHNYTGQPGQANAAVGVHRMDVSPDSTRLIAVGNFKMVDGVTHDQIVLVDLSSTAATTDPNWNTSGYTATCAANAYDTYMRDVQFSPDGAYFAVAATGGGTNTKNTDGTRALCDTATRWETTSTGTDIQPTWIDYTGNDSFESIAISGTAVYLGGHERWVNNSSGTDSPGEASIPRPGLAALDPVNGMPYLWNPGRNPRGAGAYALLLTSNGLYVGSDTTYIGNFHYYRGRIALFPLAGGENVNPPAPASLPSNVYLAGTRASATTFNDTLADRSFNGTTAGSTNTVPNPGMITWSQVRGAFMVGGTLFYGWSDGNLYERSFDGTNAGTATEADPYQDPLWDNVQTGSGQTYEGTVPSLFGSEMKSVTGMVYSNGVLYYSLSGKSALFWRYFEPDDGAIGSQEFTGSGTQSMSTVQGMFLSGNTLYWADSKTGNLNSVAFNNGSPTSITDTVVSGPGLDGNDWRSRAMFLYSSPAPTASFTASCTQLNCSFNASSSFAPGSTITNYGWTFGDGATENDATPTTSHTYGSAGTYTVTLTVTAANSQTGTTSQQIQPSANAQPVTFVAGAATTSNAATESVTVPTGVTTGDVMLLYATSAANQTLTGPAGWTRLDGVSSSALASTVWYKVATSTDAGSSVSVSGFGTSHGTVQLLDYTGTASTPVIAEAGATATKSAMSAATPTVTVPAQGGLVVSYWAAKSSAVTTWTPPSGQLSRSVDNGSGSGRINSIATDSGNPTAAGTAGGLVATTDQAGSSFAMWTVVLGASS